MPRANPTPFWSDFCTQSASQWTAGMKTTSAWWIYCAGNVSGQDNAPTPPFLSWIGHWSCGKQRPGISMQGVFEQIILGCHFRQPSQVHHSYPVADVSNDRQIVLYKQVGESILVL